MLARSAYKFLGFFIAKLKKKMMFKGKINEFLGKKVAGEKKLPFDVKIFIFFQQFIKNHPPPPPPDKIMLGLSCCPRLIMFL